MIQRLAKNAACWFRPAAGRPVFVIGTGRSGTHWVGSILASHPEIRITTEKAPMFGWSTRMALDPQLQNDLLPPLIRAYQWQIRRSMPRRYADKSHPNVWVSEQLAAAFPGALFLGIERSPFATVASMLRHEGVSAWHSRWREFPIPNRFLGIAAAGARGYDSLPLATKCAMRWVAHKRQMQRLRTALGSRLLVLVYESLVEDPRRSLAAIQGFLGLAKPFPTATVKAESLTKWQGQLSPRDVDDIASTVGFRPGQGESGPTTPPHP